MFYINSKDERRSAMQMTKHAAVRCQQRGIPKDHIEMIMQYGTPLRKPGNSVEYRLNRKTRDQILTHLKRLITLVDKCASTAVLVDGDSRDAIITAYHLK